MCAEKTESAKLVLTAVSTLCLVILVPLNAWALSTINELESRVSVVETLQVSLEKQGPRYSRYDAERDLGVLSSVLDSMGKVVDDHEGRLRIIERSKVN